jgi:hypothetical protein
MTKEILGFTTIEPYLPRDSVKYNHQRLSRIAPSVLQATRLNIHHAFPRGASGTGAGLGWRTPALLSSAGSVPRVIQI